MKFLKFLLVIFISLTSSVKADLNKNLIDQLQEGGKLIFIRHAYAPGSGDPINFNLNDCSSQRNLDKNGKEQAKKIGNFFKEKKIPIQKVISSQWCRCKETALIAFSNYQIKSFLNSFYSKKYSKNREPQIEELKLFIKKWDRKKNLILITHYVVISEILNYAPSSGEIVVSDTNFELIGSISVSYTHLTLPTICSV